MQSNVEWAISSRQKSKGPQSVVDGHQDDGLVHGSMRTVKEIATRSYGSHSQMTSDFENGRGQIFLVGTKIGHKWVMSSEPLEVRVLVTELPT